MVQAGSFIHILYIAENYIIIAFEFILSLCYISANLFFSRLQLPPDEQPGKMD